MTRDPDDRVGLLAERQDETLDAVNRNDASIRRLEAALTRFCGVVEGYVAQLGALNEKLAELVRNRKGRWPWRR